MPGRTQLKRSKILSGETNTRVLDPQIVIDGGERLNIRPAPAVREARR